MALNVMKHCNSEVSRAHRRKKDAFSLKERIVIVCETPLILICDKFAHALNNSALNNVCCNFLFILKTVNLLAQLIVSKT